MMHSHTNTSGCLEALINKTTVRSLLRLRPQNVHILLVLLLGLWARVGQAQVCPHGKDAVSDPHCRECDAQRNGRQSPRDRYQSRNSRSQPYQQRHFRCDECNMCYGNCPYNRNGSCGPYCDCIAIGDKVAVLQKGMVWSDEETRRISQRDVVGEGIYLGQSGYNDNEVGTVQITNNARPGSDCRVGYETTLKEIGRVRRYSDPTFRQKGYTPPRRRLTLRSAHHPAFQTLIDELKSLDV